MAEELKLIKVKKTFSGEGIDTPAINEINLTFDEGKFVSIIGPSGSGKSTLLSLIGTLDKPSDGTILFGNQETTKMRSKALANFRFNNIGFIFQQYHLLPTLTALENVMAPLFNRRVAYNKKERAEALLTDVGLKDKFKALPSQLSGGQQQRVAIARALVNHPKWILADEPTGNLDSKNSKLVFELLRDLNREKGMSVIFVTHDRALARKADRMIEIKDGFIISDESGEAL